MRKRLIKALLPTCASRRKGMSADVKRESQSTIVRLVLAVAGALLMVGPPFTFEILNLTSRLQSTTVAAVELVSLVVGLVVLYVAFRGQGSGS
jgi:hypothetical protein